MSATAQRKDIADPVVINEFARLVGDETRLDYLYALTVADINATNPTLWNGWRATLMRQLYHGTRQALRRGLDAPARRGERAAACRAAALDELAQNGIGNARAVELWDAPGDDFFLHHTPSQIVAITEAIDGHDLDTGPLVILLDVGGRTSADTTVVFLYARDRDHLFADSVGGIEGAGLSIAAAQVSTSASGVCFNSYVVLANAGEEVRRRLKTRLGAAIAGGSNADAPVRRVSRQLKQFVMPTEVSVETHPGTATSTLRIVASDRPGLLSALGGLFAELGISVRRARITTLGERVEDVFEITNRAKRAITHSGQADTITETIRRKLDAEIAGA